MEINFALGVFDDSNNNVFDPAYHEWEISNWIYLGKDLIEE